MNRRNFLTSLAAVPVGAAAGVSTLRGHGPVTITTPEMQPNGETLRLIPPGGDQYLEFYHDGTDIVVRHGKSGAHIRFEGGDQGIG